MSAKKEREIQFQAEFYYFLKKTIESKREIKGFRFSRVEMEYPINGGKADIVLFDECNKPFIVIETKRKNGHVSSNIDPLGFRVIQQSLGYASYIGAPFFATANREFLASFTVPLQREPFSIERHRVLITQIKTLNDELTLNFLNAIISYHQAPTPEEKLNLTTALDWTFVLRLRSFVSWLAVEVEPVLKSRLKIDKQFDKKVTEFAAEKGFKFTPQILAKEMSYILMNKIVFYKVLERTYLHLPKLGSIKENRPKFFLSELYRLFEESIQTTKDFEAVFDTGIYDEIVLPDSPTMLLDVIDGLKVFINDMETYHLEKLNADVIGHVYEELLEPEERHKLGQFYTPPAIAELICKWAIRQGNDTVLDPSVGSGTFIVKAYQRLKQLKLENTAIESGTIHLENIRQLFAIDINPFPAHLTSVNLAMRDVNHPVSELNVLREDFFKVRPNQIMFLPYSIKTLRGNEEHRQIRIPLVSAVVGNPPYTRWTEILDPARDAITSAIESDLKKFKMYAGNTKSEPMIYLHFLIHANNFLANNGRLAMIISNSWLQTDYGIKFGMYLLSNFRIVGVIDFSSRVFAIPLVATLVVLLEKESDKSRRDNNKVAFLFIDKEEQLKPDMILKAMENPKDYSNYFWVNVFNQKDLDCSSKLVKIFFGAGDILNRIIATPNMVLAKELFTVATGNTGWAYWALKHGSRTNIGAKRLFYLTREDIKNNELDDVYPAITTARYAKFFSFGKEDWEKLAKKNKAAYFFMCHKSRNDLSEAASDHVRWGETECRTTIRRTRGGGKICNKALTCQAREKTTERFFGWYDLGGSKYTPIMAVYQSQYRTRFFYCKEDFVAYPAIVTYLPKENLSELELKAILAFLNSSLSQLHVEIEGRATALGLIALEVTQAEEIPIPDVKKLPKEQLEKLAETFDALEGVTRSIGGANTLNCVKALEPQFERIDSTVAEIFGFPDDLIKRARDLVTLLMERRLARTKLATPELLKSEERALEMIAPSKKTRVARKESKNIGSAKLDRWSNTE
jgi:type I restriction-modification system DNA methylase subunit